MPWPWTKPKSNPTPALSGEVVSAFAEISALLLAFPDPALLLDKAGTVMAANHQAKSLFENDPSHHHISFTLRAPNVLAGIAQVGQTAQSLQVEYEVHGPQPQQFLVHISPVNSATTNGTGLLLVLKDLTRQQQIERMRSDFVANASHELRTPLASLSGFIETLLGAARHDAVAREKFLLLMRSQSERMRRLIDDLLSLSRIEMNVSLKPSQHIDLAQVAQHARDALAVMAQDANIKVSVNVSSQIVLGDWDELVQVMLNLLENALKYSGSGTRVEITGSAAAGVATVSIADEGPGIAPEHLPRLTERFYRINVQESRSRGGTGLGLAIVKHILNRHRGRLIVDSELGRGSKFTLQIPEI